MKKIFKSVLFVAMAAMGLSACSKDDMAEENSRAKKITIDITATMDHTRSQFGDKVGDAYPSKWNGTEQVAFFLNEDTELSKATPTVEGERAVFSNVTLPASELTDGTIYAFSPIGKYEPEPNDIIGGFINTVLDSGVGYITLVIPAVQTPLANSCDETAHFLVGKYDYTGGVPTAVNMQFAHVAAYGKMTITNFAGGDISNVVIRTPKGIVGNGCRYRYSTGELFNAAGYELTLNATNVENNVFWFGCAPSEMSSGVVTVTVNAADGKQYVKNITLSSEKYMWFEQGAVSSFTVDMSGIEATPEAKGADLPFVESFSNVAATSGLGSNMTVDKFPQFSSLTGAVRSYNEAGVVVFGTGTAAASMTTIGLDLSEQSTVVVRAKQYGSDTNKLRVTVNGVNYDAASNLTANYVDYKFSLPAVGSNVKVTLTTTAAKRAMISCMHIEKGDVDEVAHQSLVLDKESISFTADGGTETITAEAVNMDYPIDATCTNDHFTISVSDNIITVTAPANETSSSITGSITVTAGSFSEKVLVSQEGNGSGGTKSVTFNYNTTYNNADDQTIDGITASFSKASGSNAPAYYSSSNGIRLYAKNTYTISSTDKTIERIEYTFYKQGSKPFAQVTVSPGDYESTTDPGSSTTTPVTGTWTGSANEVVLTMGSSGQRVLDNVKVYYK